MVVDTSALIAVLWDEPERRAFVSEIQDASTRLISAGSVLEAAIVVMRRAGQSSAAEAISELTELVDRLGLEIEPVNARQTTLAGAAYREYGKGFHSAGLNFGDCFAFALAKESGEPLLFKGDDFSQTDITCCLIRG